MAFCSKCGNQLIDGKKFCNKCGAAVKTAVAVAVPAPKPVYAAVQAKAVYAAPVTAVAEKPVAPQTTGVKVYKAQKGQLIVGIRPVPKPCQPRQDVL